MKTDKQLPNSIHIDWKPVDKQAAIVTSRASWIHQPPQVSTKPIKTPEQEHAEWLDSVRRDVERNDYEAKCAAERRKIRKEAKASVAASKNPKVRRMRCNWVRRALKLKNKLAGLPPPTNEEILAEKKRQPNYGKPMFAIPKEQREKQLSSMLTPQARDFYERSLAEMDCFGEPYQSQHELALQKALVWQSEQKKSMRFLE